MYKAIVILCILLNFCFAYSRIVVPLSNLTGVPYYKGKLDFHVSGFDIDNKGGLYFLAGANTTLVKFSAEGKEVYRKTFTAFQPNPMTIRQDKLYIFDNNYSKNSLFILNTEDGSIVKTVSKVIDNVVNSFWYSDSFLVFEVFNAEKNITMKTQLGFVLSGLDGKLKGETDTRYALPDSIYPRAYENETVWYLGKWKDQFLFQVYDFDNRQFKFWLADLEGHVSRKNEISETFFGKRFSESPQEHWKLRNGLLYVLTRKEDKAVITKIGIEELFATTGGRFENE